MENEEKTMTGEESLRIITEMLNKTRINIRQGSFHLLFWGWLVVFCSLAEYILSNFHIIDKAYRVWYLVIPGALISVGFGIATGRKARVHTYADKVWMWTWIAFLISMTVLIFIHSRNMESISPYILMLVGFPTFVSGIIIRFRPLIVGGICFWILAILVYLAPPSINHLGIPVAMIIGYLIPGYILKSKVDDDTV